MYADAQTGRRAKGAKAYRQRGDCFRGSIGCFAVFARYLLAVASRQCLPFQGWSSSFVIGSNRVF